MEHDGHGAITKFDLVLLILFRTFCKTSLSHVKGWQAALFVNNRLRHQLR